MDSKKEIANLFDENTNKDLIEMKEKLKESLSNENLQASYLKDLRLKLHHSLYENHSFKDNSEIINDIIKEIEEFILNNISLDGIIPIIETLESLMILFLFHFDLNIIKIGYSLEKFLISNLEDNYCNDLLEYFLSIIQFLNNNYLYI